MNFSKTNNRSVHCKSAKTFGIWHNTPVSKIINEKDQSKLMTDHWKRIQLTKGKTSEIVDQKHLQHKVYVNEAQNKERKRQKVVDNKLQYKRLLNIESKPGTYSKQELDKTYNIIRRDKFIKSRNAIKMKQLKEKNEKFYEKIDRIQAYTKNKTLTNEYDVSKKRMNAISHNARRVEPDYSSKSIYYYHVANLDDFKDTIAMTQNEYANKYQVDRAKSVNDIQNIEEVPESDNEGSCYDDYEIENKTTMNIDKHDFSKQTKANTYVKTEVKSELEKKEQMSNQVFFHHKPKSGIVLAERQRPIRPKSAALIKRTNNLSELNNNLNSNVTQNQIGTPLNMTQNFSTANMQPPNNFSAMNHPNNTFSSSMNKPASMLLDRKKKNPFKVIGVMDVVTKHKNAFKLVDPFYNGKAKHMPDKKLKKNTSASKLYFNEDNTSFSHIAKHHIDRKKYFF